MMAARRTSFRQRGNQERLRPSVAPAPVTARRNAFILPAVRRILAIFLLFVLPMQWATAAFGDCCYQGDETVQSHAAGPALAGDDVSAWKPGSDDGGDKARLACAACVFCCAHAMVGAFSWLPPEIAAHNVTPYLSSAPDSVRESLFRPPVPRLA